MPSPLPASTTELGRARSSPIDVVTRRLGERRRRIGTETAALRHRLRERPTSPGALLAAGGVGVALEQSKRRRRWSLLSALNVFNALATLLATMTEVNARRTRPSSDAR